MSNYISLPTYQNRIDQRYLLIGNRCKNCREIYFPKKMICLKCGSKEFEDYPLKGIGTLFTFTVIAKGAAPTEFDDQQAMTGDLLVGIVALEEGPKIAAQLTDLKADDLYIGMPLKMVFRRLYEQEGVIRYSFKFSSV